MFFSRLFFAPSPFPSGGWQPLSAGHELGAASFTVFVKGAGFDFSFGWRVGHPKFGETILTLSLFVGVPHPFVLGS
jgi:hypothetical protein